MQYVVCVHLMIHLPLDIIRTTIAYVEPMKLGAFFAHHELDFQMPFSYCNVVNQWTLSSLMIFPCVTMTTVSSEYEFNLMRLKNKDKVRRVTFGYVPDLSQLEKFKDLRLLRVHFSSGLFDLRSSSHCEKLETIELYDCCKLKSMCGMPASVRHIKLFKCKGSINLDEIYRRDRNLRSLVISGETCIDINRLSRNMHLQSVRLHSQMINMGDLSCIRNLCDLVLNACGDLVVSDLVNCCNLKKLILRKLKVLKICDLHLVGKLKYFEWYGNRGDVLINNLSNCVNLERVKLWGLDAVTEENLGKCVGLKSIEIVRCDVVLLANFVKCKQFRKIVLNDRVFDPRCDDINPYRGKIEMIPDLECVKLRLAGIEHLMDITAISRCCSMEEIDFSGCSGLSYIEPLGKIESLKKINLSRTGIIDVMALGKLKLLEHLDLGGCVKLIGVNGLEECEKLKAIILSGIEHLMDITAISRCCSMEEIDFSGCSGLSYIEPLGKIESLKKINLSRTGIIDVMALGKLKLLEHLDLGGCVKLIDVNGLEECEKLKAIILSGTVMKNIDVLGNLKSLEHLDVSYCGNLMGLEGLKGLVNGLEYINLRGCGKIVDVSILGGCDELRYLNIVGCERILNMDFLTKLGKLERILMEGCVGLKSLPPLRVPKLKQINLAKCFNLRGVLDLTECLDLVSLNVRNCPVTPIVIVGNLKYFNWKKSGYGGGRRE